MRAHVVEVVGQSVRLSVTEGKYRMVRRLTAVRSSSICLVSSVHAGGVLINLPYPHFACISVHVWFITQAMAGEASTRHLRAPCCRAASAKVQASTRAAPLSMSQMRALLHACPAP